MTIPTRAEITLGIRARIVEKRNQKNGKMTEGIVKKILTDSFDHPHGIMVELENGAIGRVKEVVMSEKSYSPMESSKTYENLDIRSLNEDMIRQLIRRGENDKIEFKASFRFDIRKFKATGNREKNKEVEKSVSKVVASFMNSHGGLLLIGISDEGEILGIEEDLKLLNRQNIDTFRLQLKNSLESYLINKIIYEHLTIEFSTIGGKIICVISVIESLEPIFLTDEGRQECYVRIDNESRPFQYNEFYTYLQRRAKKIP